MAQPVKSVNDLAQDIQERFAVPIVIEDVFSGVAPGGHMVNRTVEFHSERTSHDPSELSQQVTDSKIQDLTPYAAAAKAYKNVAVPPVNIQRENVVDGRAIP